jgi:UDP-N-acetylglucosamine 2-epimerase (non-hydrolysing)
MRVAQCVLRCDGAYIDTPRKDPRSVIVGGQRDDCDAIPQPRERDSHLLGAAIHGDVIWPEEGNVGTCQHLHHSRFAPSSAPRSILARDLQGCDRLEALASENGLEVQLVRIMSVVGARPEFIQLAPLAWALQGTQHEHLIVHTGQHYDALMSDVFFRDLDVPSPVVSLGVGSASHGRQTGEILAAAERAMQELQPDWVVVFGDTNSTLAGALAAVKLHVPVAHVEAGLRSHNRRMPEEHNRIVADHLADVLYAPTFSAMKQLRSEGLIDRAVHVGDIKTEVTLRVRDLVRDLPPPVPPAARDDGGYYLATIHRAENTDDAERLASVVEGLARADLPVVLLVHPRLQERAARFGLRLDAGSLVPTDPLAYPQMLTALLHSQGVVTDSGGIQKEAFLLRVPTTTVRTETEWVETVQLGWNVLVEPDGIVGALRRPAPPETDAAPFGRGDTAHLIVRDLEER